MNSQLNQHAAWMRCMQAHIQAGNITPANARLAFQRFQHEHLQRQRQQQQSQQRHYEHQKPQYQSQYSTTGSNFSGQPSGQQLPHPSSHGALSGQQFPRTSDSNNMRFPLSNMAQQCALNRTQSNLSSSGYVTPGIDSGATSYNNISMGNNTSHIMSTTQSTTRSLSRQTQSTHSNSRTNSAPLSDQQAQSNTNAEKQPGAVGVGYDRFFNRNDKSVGQSAPAPAVNTERRPAASRSSSPTAIGLADEEAKHITPAASPAPQQPGRKRAASGESDSQEPAPKRSATPASNISLNLHPKPYSDTTPNGARSRLNPPAGPSSNTPIMNANGQFLQQQYAHQNELQEQIRLAEEQRLDQERRVMRKEALRRDPSALFRHYHEYLEYYPLAIGENKSPYHTKLLANQRMPSDEKCDLGMAITYAREHWDIYLEYPKDIKRAVEYAKEKAARKALTWV